VVSKLSVGPFDNNAYLLADPETGEALLVDAANEAERLLGLLEGVKLVGIVTTHRHADHIQALTAVLKAHEVWNGAHPADADEIANLVGVRPDRLLEHGATIRVGRFEVGVLHTPGHTEGSISFRLPSSQVLTGDALFPGGVGKTQGRAAFEQAIDSAERHLLSLPGETRISPGHGDDTEVARELPQLDEWKARGW
jgi:glyoxylase-like metal-dependent hydrolase (beta-lactamase superfamily II)